MTDDGPARGTLEVIVNLEVCDGHGQCEFAAPAVFQLDEEGDLSYDAHPDISEKGRVEQAIRLCPVQAIELGP